MHENIISTYLPSSLVYFNTARTKSPPSTAAGCSSFIVVVRREDDDCDEVGIDNCLGMSSGSPSAILKHSVLNLRLASCNKDKAIQIMQGGRMGNVR